MGGSGPWLGPMTFGEAAQPGGIEKASATGIRARESFANAQGANGLFELELNNWEWRREINFGWLEFSRWGIQQIILLSGCTTSKIPSCEGWSTSARSMFSGVASKCRARTRTQTTRSRLSWRGIRRPSARWL